ncbi:MAG: MBL fold metallo-hydrolase, partial [Chloroflexi bacterium]|nr:MBL fold metallo-hydrolase [Chloroflexota bacterium]
LHTSGQIPHVPIFVDSPLSTNATEVFRLHPEYYDQETYQFMLKYRDPFGFGQLRYIRQVEDSKALNDQREPMVIISASGMCEAGRVLHHLKNNIEDPRNTVLFVGFQAEHTLGRRIMDGYEEIPIFGDKYRLRATVESIDGYSAHADRAELLAYINKLDGQRLRRVFIVHGEEEAASSLKQGLEEMGVRKVRVPELGERAQI